MPGWVIAVLLPIVAITAFAFVASDVSSSCVASGGPFACPAQPAGPGGVPVIDAFYFAHQPVTGNGTLTVHKGAEFITPPIAAWAASTGAFALSPAAI